MSSSTLVLVLSAAMLVGCGSGSRAASAPPGNGVWVHLDEREGMTSELVHSDDSRLVCTSPCDSVIDARGQKLFVTSGRNQWGSSFRIGSTTREAWLTPKGDGPVYGIGAGSLILGSIGSGIGAIVLVIGVLAEPPGGGPDKTADIMKPVGGTMLGIGAFGALTGGILMILDRPRIDVVEKP